MLFIISFQEYYFMKMDVGDVSHIGKNVGHDKLVSTKMIVVIIVILIIVLIVYYIHKNNIIYRYTPESVKVRVRNMMKR